MPTLVEGHLFKVDVGETVLIDGTEKRAVESCGSSRGQWYCATHRSGFEHNFAKDSHVSEAGDHTLAWRCFEHGPEVP